MKTSDELRAMIECEANNPQVRLGIELVLPTVEALEIQKRALIVALKSILDHVENENIDRIGPQCTLCYSYRAMGHAVLEEVRDNV
jgi:hypothetical protein